VTPAPSLSSSSLSSPSPPEPLPGARLLFSLDPAVAYLNHGSSGVTPVPVQRAQQRLRDELEANPQRFYTRGLHDRLAHARRHIASFCGADPDGTALIANTTAGIGIVLHSLALRTGDEVVTTDHRYGTVDYAVAATGATLRAVPVPLDAPGEYIVDLLRAAVTPGRTRLVIVDLVSSPTARLFPVAAIAETLRGTGIPLLVDGAHGPASLPLNVDALGADFFVGNIHKWGFAPRSTAILTVTPPWRERIRPLVQSWAQPYGYPASVEFGGTLDYTAWLAAPTGLFTLRTLGAERVRAHNAALATYGQHVIATALGLDPAALPDPAGPLPMRLIPLPGNRSSSPEEAVALRERIADELRTEVAVNAWRDRLLLRICGQVYNRPDEYERLAAGLPALLR
jgi:isopenicillin-N epimerase